MGVVEGRRIVVPLMLMLVVVMVMVVVVVKLVMVVVVSGRAPKAALLCRVA